MDTTVSSGKHTIVGLFLRSVVLSGNGVLLAPGGNGAAEGGPMLPTGAVLIEHTRRIRRLIRSHVAAGAA